MIYEVDLDGTLCTNTQGRYEEAQPLKSNIQKVNALYESGHTININTGRGSTTDINWRSLTEEQLKIWGIKYHTLMVGEKPYYDYIIDDKSIDIAKETWNV